MKVRLSFLLMLLLVGFFSCTSTENNTDTSLDSTDTDSANVTSTQNKPNEIFNLPSPIDLFSVLKENKIPFNKVLLNNNNNIEYYVSSDQKSVNIGVFASDIAYSAVYGMNEETMNLFVTAKRLADDLGLSEGFDDKTIKRIDKNLTNSDSLYSISTNSYATALNFLRSQHQEEILPLMIFGSWIESIYITTYGVNDDNFDSEDPVVLQLVDQGFLLENLNDYFTSLTIDNDAIITIKKQLSDLQSSYDVLQDNEEEIITKEQYSNIITKIRTIRKYWTK